MADSLTPKEEFLLNPVTEHSITDAAIATFETNLRHPLKVEIPFGPKQDLHGYDHPWPAGGWKNLLKTGGLVQGAPSDTSFSNTTKRTFTIGTFVTNLTPNNYYQPNRVQEVSVSENSVSVRTNASAYAVSIPITGLTIGSTYTFSSVNTNGEMLASFYKEDGTFISNTERPQTKVTVPAEAYYTLIHFNPYTDSTDLVTFTNIQLELGSAATAYSPYENLCPISGWTGAEIPQRGKNLLNPANATVTHSNIRYNKTSILLKGGVTYTLCSTIKPSGLYVDSADGSYKSAVYGNQILKITPPKDVECTFDAYWAESVLPSGGLSVDMLSLKVGETTDTSYAPYTGNQISVNWETEAGTVYGGTLTLNSDGTVDLANSYRYFIAPLESVPMYTNDNVKFFLYTDWNNPGNKCKPQGNVVCSIYPSGHGNGNVWLGWPGNYGNCLVIQDNSVSTVEEMLAKIDGAEFAYELDTPVTYHFDNVGQLYTFLGTNNIWSDIGNINVKYLTQNSDTGMEYRGDRALELRRRAMLADAPTIHTTVGSSETGGIASFKSYIKAPVKKIEIPFGPKQDLHGYDHPWPAGGGKNIWGGLKMATDIQAALSDPAGAVINENLKTVVISAGYLTNNPVFFEQTFKANTQYTLMLACNKTEGNTNSNIMVEYTDGTADYIFLTNPIATKQTIVHVTAANKTLANVHGINASSYLNLYYEESGLFEGVLTASDFSPYKNLCPISGWTGAEATRTGKNLWGGLQMGNDFVNGVNVPSNCYLGSDENGDYVTYAAGMALMDKIVFGGPFKENTQYTLILNFKRTVDNINVNLVIYYTDGTQASVQSSSGAPNILHTFVFITAANKTVAGIFTGYYDGRIYLYYNNSGLFEGVLTADDFVPYTGNQISVNWEDEAGTVYGGTLTLNQDRTGTLVAMHRSATLTGAESFTWSKYGEQTLYTTNTVLPGSPNTQAIKGWCSAVGTIQNGDIDVTLLDKTSLTSPGIEFKKCLEYWRLPEVTGAALTAKLAEMNSSGKPFQIVYELNDPVTIPLTAEQVSGILTTLYGTNNFWSDISDDITVKYWNRGFGN